MNRLNLIFTLSSLSVVLVTIERFSFTTKILLQPYNFLRLHELVQMSLLILLTVLIPFFLLKEITTNFKVLKSQKDCFLVALFIVGVYFYATGNGVHEVSSFYYNHYCDTKRVAGDLCGGFFFNDYYTGNILYFAGGILMIAALLFLEKDRPNGRFQNKDLPILIINALLYAFAIVAYAAFDKVLVGLIYSIAVAIMAGILFSTIRKRYVRYPVITYTTLTYILGTVAAILTRLFH